MRVADEFQQVRAGLWFWQAYEPAVKTDLSCCAVALSAGLVFIDPIPLAEAALAQLCEMAKPAAIILTNGNHERAAEDFRKKFDVPVFAHASARAALTIDVDSIADGISILKNELTVVELLGFGPGEIALHSPAHGGAFFIGDALINPGSHGFATLPAKYCSDAKLARASLQKLLQFDFELMTFAHGLPIVTRARQRLEQLLV